MADHDITRHDSSNHVGRTLSRRQVMVGAAATAMVAATPAIAGKVAKIAGVDDRPQWLGPQKYSGPGWYAFEYPMASFPRSYVKFCEIEESTPYRFVTMKSSQDGEVEWYMSGIVFDELCTGRFYTADENDRRHKAGRYANT